MRPALSFLLPLLLAAPAAAAGIPALLQLPDRTENVPQAPPAAVPGGLDDIAIACPPPSASEEVIYQSDFRWDYSLPEMKSRFEEMYVSRKRLDNRAYRDEAAGSLVLPAGDGKRPVKIGPVLTRALARHIERALELGYADAVFFPDMGHSHLLIPQTLWDSKYAGYPVSESSRMYEELLSDPAIRIFYHTAEQLKTLENGQPIDDAQLLFRRANRNIAGPISPDAELSVYMNPESAANTVHDVPGYRWWGAGFNFSAQKDGCFSYTFEGRTYRFDISLHDLPMPPGSGEDW